MKSAITDRDGMVLISTDESLQGKFLPRRMPLSQLTQRGSLHQVKVLAGPPKIYEFDFPFHQERPTIRRGPRSGVIRAPARRDFAERQEIRDHRIARVGDFRPVWLRW